MATLPPEEPPCLHVRQASMPAVLTSADAETEAPEHSVLVDFYLSSCPSAASSSRQEEEEGDEYDGDGDGDGDDGRYLVELAMKDGRGMNGHSLTRRKVVGRRGTLSIPIKPTGFIRKERHQDEDEDEDDDELIVTLYRALQKERKSDQEEAGHDVEGLQVITTQAIPLAKVDKRSDEEEVVSVDHQSGSVIVGAADRRPFFPFGYYYNWGGYMRMQSALHITSCSSSPSSSSSSC